MLTLPAHLQLNYGKPLDPTHRDALRTKSSAPPLTSKTTKTSKTSRQNF